MPTLPGSRGSRVFGAFVSVSWIWTVRGTPRKLSDPLDRGRGEACNALAAAHETHAFVGAELHVHQVAVESRCGRDLRAHPVAVWAEARRFADDRGVDRPDCVAAVRELVAHAREQIDAARVLPLRVGVGEVVADVAERGGAE